MKRSLSVRLHVPLFLLTTAFALSSLFSGCAPKREDTLVATIGKTPITLSEYEKLYMKSGGTDSVAKATQEEREKFLDLMVKYRKKLLDAYEQGMDKRPELIGEIQQYKGSLAASYLTDRELVTPAVRKMYDRSREEIRASHILLTFKQGATHEDSALVLQQAAEIITEAKAGTDFGQLAVSHSQDPSAKSNQGDLYYFSVGRMVPEFEEAVFALKKGEISSSPAFTRFGAHIIKVTDRKPSSGETRCAHIMIRFTNQNPSPEDTLAAFNKIKLVDDSLKTGLDFGGLAMRHSEDAGSVDRGGDLGWFSRGRWPQPFDEAAMLLKPGENSPIVRTVYGYHLIHCYETRPPKTFDEARQELQNTYQQQRFQTEYASYIAGIRKQVGFVRNDSIAHAFTTSFDSTKTTRDSAWADVLTPSLRNAAIFRFTTGPVSVDSVLGVMKSHPEWSNLSLHRVTLNSTLDKIAEQLTFAAKADMLERQDPEFAGLLREYKEGILLYQAEQEHVWNRVTTNDSLLRIYFNKNRDSYVYPDRVLFSEIRAASESQAKRIQEKIRAGKTLEQIAFEDSVRMKLPSSFVVPFAAGKSTIGAAATRALKEVAAAHAGEPQLQIMLVVSPDTSIRKSKNQKLATQRLDAVRRYLTTQGGVAATVVISENRPQRFAADKIRDTLGITDRVDVQILGRQPLVLSAIERQLLAPAADERARRADSLAVGAASAPFSYKVTYSIVRLDAREPSRQKTFEEASAEVSSHYQDYESKRLEKEWMDGVAQRHPVTLYKESLRQAFAPSEK